MEELQVKNKVLLVCTNKIDPLDILKGITKTSEINQIPNETLEKNFIKQFNWNIITKYYTADLELWVCDLKVFNLDNLTSPITSDFLCEVSESIIIVFDGTEKDDFKEVQKWETIINDGDFSSSLCVANFKEDENINQENIEEYSTWCTNQNVEFVEITNTKDTEEDNDEEYPELKGFDRINESLQTIMWENMEYKTELRPTNPQETKNIEEIEQPEKEEPESSFGNEIDGMFNSFLNMLGEKPQTDKNIDSVDGDEDKDFMKEMAEFDNFEKTLLQLKELREKASTLPNKERKDLAEAVALAFYENIS